MILGGPFEYNYPTNVYQPGCSGESEISEDTESQFSTCESS